MHDVGQLLTSNHVISASITQLLNNYVVRYTELERLLEICLTNDAPENPPMHFPRPECTAYDPNTPPPGWPNFVAPWDQRVNIPPNMRCNLIPPLMSKNSKTVFDAYQRQMMDGGSKVIIIDVRTPEEVYWIGVPTQVNKITLKNGHVIIPDYFTATLHPTSDNVAPSLHYAVNGVPMSTLSSDVASTSLTGISHNIPIEYVDSTTGVTTLNPIWGKQVDALIRDLHADRIVFFCRSGQRSSIGCYYEYCPFATLFPGILSGQMMAYEVESEENGYGGFEGSQYSNAMLGYRGFPGRYTASSANVSSSSFKDMGLPIKIGTYPKIIRIQPTSGETLALDTLDARPWAENH